MEQRKHFGMSVMSALLYVMADLYVRFSNVLLNKVSVLINPSIIRDRH